MSEQFNPYFEWLGISPDERQPNHYQLLGVPTFVANPKVIDNAADRQMAHLRTFQASAHAAVSQRLLNEVAAARICLLKPQQKAAYDAGLRARLGQPPLGAPTAAPPFNPAQYPGHVQPALVQPAPAQPMPVFPAAAYPAPVAPQPAPAPLDVIDSFVMPEAGAGEFRSARGSAGRKRTSRSKKTGAAGLGAYAVAVFAVGIVGLAAILWGRANHWQFPLVEGEQTKASNAETGEKPKQHIASDALNTGEESDSKPTGRGKQTDSNIKTQSSGAKPEKRDSDAVAEAPTGIESAAESRPRPLGQALAEPPKVNQATAAPGSDTKLAMAASGLAQPKQPSPGATGADDTDDVNDPTKAKLDRAKKVYDGELEKYREAVAAYFGKREDAARKAGNKKLVEQLKAERNSFDESGHLPATAPTALQKKLPSLRTTMESAYRMAAKEYKHMKQAGAAAKVTKELEDFKRVEVSTREYWVATTDGLSYEKTNGREWLERQGGKVSYVFEEDARNGKFIEIIDRGRNVRVRMYEASTEVLDSGTSWAPHRTGAWNERPAEKPETFQPVKRRLWVATDGLAYEKTTGNEWVERHGGAIAFIFDEVDRNDEFIEIIDRQRKIRVRLGAEASMQMHPGKAWEPQRSGTRMWTEIQ